jgi:hypothetical protein
MKVDHLISPLVTDEDYERTMILFDTIVDENWDTLVKLFSHPEEKKSKRGREREKNL